MVTSPQTWQCVTGPSCAHARVPHRGPPRPTSPRWRKRGNCGGQEPTSSSSPTMSPPSPTATSLFDGPVVGRPSAVPYSFQTRARRSQGAGSQSAEGASHLCLQPRLVRERQPVMVECRCTFDALLAISGASEEAIRSQRTKSPTKVHGKHLNVSTSVSSPTASSYSFREMHVRACSNWLVAVSAIRIKQKTLAASCSQQTWTKVRPRGLWSLEPGYTALQLPTISRLGSTSSRP